MTWTLDSVQAAPEPEAEAEASLGLLGRVLNAVLTSSDGALSDTGSGGHGGGHGGGHIGGHSGGHIGGHGGGHIGGHGGGHIGGHNNVGGHGHGNPGLGHGHGGGHHEPEVLVSSGYGAPVSYHAPTNSYGPPSPGYGAPIDSYGAPVGGCACRRSFNLLAGLFGGQSGQKPDEPCVCDGYAAPVDSYGAPVSGYGAPVDSYGAPSYDAPVPAYNAPVPTYDAPLPSYGAPVSECLCRREDRFFLGGGSSGQKPDEGCDCGPGYNAPVSGYGAPGSGYGAPCIKRTFHTGGGHGGNKDKDKEHVIVECGYGAPASGYGVPYEAPISSYGAPGYSAPGPVVSHHQPFHEVPSPHIPTPQIHHEPVVVHESHEIHEVHHEPVLIHESHEVHHEPGLIHDGHVEHAPVLPDIPLSPLVSPVHEIPHHDTLVVDNDISVPVSVCRDEVTTLFEEHCDTLEEEVCETLTENVCSTSTEEVCHTNEIEVCDDFHPHTIHTRSADDNLVVNRDLFDAARTQAIGETNVITAEVPVECDPNEIECFQTTECKPVVQEVCFTVNEVTHEERCVDAGATNCFENLVEECQDPATRTGCVQVPKKVCPRSCTKVPRFQQVEKCEPREQQSCELVPVCRPRPGCGPAPGPAPLPQLSHIQLHSSVASHVASQQLITPFVHGSVAGGLTADGLPPRLPVPAPAVPPEFEAELPRQPKSGGCRIEAVQECEAVPRTNCQQLPQQECHLVPRQQCRNVPVEKVNRVC